MDKLSFLHFLFLCLEFLGLALLSLSMFRIPVSLYKVKIAIITVTMALVSFYVRDVLDMFNYSVMLVLACYVTLTLILFRLPLLYALLVCITGYLAAAMIQVLIGVIGMSAGLTTTDKLSDSFVHYTTLQVLTAAVAILITLILHKRKLGFMFIAKRFQGKEAVKGYNFILSGILLLAVVMIQLAVLSFKISSVHLYLIFCMLALFIIAITVSYFQNKKLLRDKYKQSRMTRTYGSH